MSPPDMKGGADPHAQNSATKQQTLPNYKNAALDWFHRGLQVIPIVPLLKQTAVKWDPWLEGLSESTIDTYWTVHPTHEVGCIVGDEMIVFDADTPQAVAALAEIEKAFDITPSWVNKTRRGEHNFFRRAAGTFAKTNAHATADHPERIDIKTGRSMVILPPSTGKSVDLREVDHASELSEASQDFIDAVFRHNGSPAPRPAPERPAEPDRADALLLQQRDMALLLDQLNPDCGYTDWCTVGMAVHHTFSGDERGLDLFDRWSAKGADYPGYAEISAKWKSFNAYAGTPVSIGSVCKLARDQGVDIQLVAGSSWETFDITTTETVNAAPVSQDVQTPVLPEPDAPRPKPIFSRYSLTGYSYELAKEVQEETFVLPPLALRGQATVWYAPPNAGKTAIAISRTIFAINAGLVDAKHVFYLNADDTSHGLLLKVKLAEEHGFHMLAPGHRDFDLKKFLAMLRQACEDGTARDVVLIVDTLKKTTDLMDKQKASAFTRVVREFVSHGGTFLGLAHVNTKPGADGKPVHAGTTDIKDDFDCAYVMQVIDNGRESGSRLVEFINEKRRGSVADTVRFRYRAGNGISYEEMLESIELVEATEADSGVPLTAEEEDAEAISVVEHSIRSGECKKIDLIKALQKHAGLSRRAAQALLARHTGHVPTLSKWSFEVREHGAHCYRLLNEPPDATNDKDSDNEPTECDY